MYLLTTANAGSNKLIFKEILSALFLSEKILSCDLLQSSK